MSSLKISESSLWSLTIFFKRVVTGSHCPLWWKPSVSVTANFLLKGVVPKSSAVLIGMLLCTMSSSLMISLSLLVPHRSHSTSQKLTSVHCFKISLSSLVWMGIKTLLRTSGGINTPSAVTKFKTTQARSRSRLTSSIRRISPSCQSRIRWRTSMADEAVKVSCTPHRLNNAEYFRKSSGMTKI